MSLLERRLDNVVTRLGFADQPAPGPADDHARAHHWSTAGSWISPATWSAPATRSRSRTASTPASWPPSNLADGAAPGPRMAGPDQHRPSRGPGHPPAVHPGCRLPVTPQLIIELLSR